VARSSTAFRRADSFARMPKPRIYVETTIPSVYHTDRTDPVMARHRAATRSWWEAAVHSCELLTSPAVLIEAARGRREQALRRLALLQGLELLVSSEAIAETAATYIRHKLMPADPRGDALHLALASHHKCDVLVTWNYRHLANANKLDRIVRLNGELGLPVPRILTPVDLLEENS
jgi:predicted nucleic acid-binding protein